MSSISFDRYQPHVSLLKNQAALTANTGIDLWQKALSYAIELGWEALDNAIAASLWTVDLGIRFNQWTEDPRNKERVNQAADTITAVGEQALDAWCIACAATIEAGYQSRPHIERVYDRMRSLLTTLVLLVRFFLALRVLLARMDWEEVEEYQPALPAAPQPVALLAPGPTTAAVPTDALAPRLKDLSLRKLRVIAIERGLKSRNAEGKPWRKEELLAVLSYGEGRAPCLK